MGMEIAIIIFVLVVGVLSLAVGADSRIDDVERRRHYLG
jgi:hypothetical protein